MKCEVIAVGTELLLGDVVDTNSSYIGSQLAMSGIDSHFQVKVGDNLERITECISTAAQRSDFIIMCGGLGPTQDDITRNAVAEVMGVPLVRHPELVEKIQAVFAGREMTDNNLVQADLPEGATAIPVMGGTAPGFVCEFKNAADESIVLYAVPGVPWEMMEMMDWVTEDMRKRSGFSGVIKSCILKTWGLPEAELAELLAEEIERLDSESEAGSHDNSASATLAFLASGWEGLKVRITAKADSEAEAIKILQHEEAAVRKILPDELIFGKDEETMETVVLELCKKQGLKLAVAESLTGGLISSRLTAVAGSSDVFLGGVVSYAKDVKVAVLGADPEKLAVSQETASAMAKGAISKLGADCSLAVTGVAGPDPLEGVEPGTIWIASVLDGECETVNIKFPFDRERTRQFTVITALNMFRTRLLKKMST